MNKKLLIIATCSVLFLLTLNSHASAADQPAELFDAIKTGDTAKVEQLLTTGSMVRTGDEHGVTALMVAAFLGNVNMAKLLVEKGADLNSKSDNGLTALMIASAKGKQELVQLLLDQGADANILDTSGLNAFQMAVAGQHKEVAGLLKPHTKVTLAPTTKTVVGSLEKGQTCLPVMNFPNESQKKIKCLREGQEVGTTGVATNTKWSLIQKPVWGWVPTDKLKEVVVTEVEKKPSRNESSSENGSQAPREHVAPSPQGESGMGSEDIPSTRGGGGGGAWWRR